VRTKDSSTGACAPPQEEKNLLTQRCNRSKDAKDKT
jgi:hypothetical protein